MRKSCLHIPNRSAFTLIELLVSMAVIVVLVALLLPAIQGAREAARRTECRNNLKQIGLGLHSFEGTFGVYPASGWTQESRLNPSGAYLSWRVSILPFLEQSALASEYEYDKDWWSEQNLSLARHPVSVFQCPSVPAQPAIAAAVAKAPRPAIEFSAPLSGADYEAMMGVRSIIQPDIYTSKMSTRSVLYRNSETKHRDITDGTSNTVAVVECAARPLVYRENRLWSNIANDQGFGWTDSESAFSLDGSSADGSVQGLGVGPTPVAINSTNENEPYSFHDGGMYCLFADGHVQFVSETIDLRVFASLATKAARD